MSDSALQDRKDGLKFPGFVNSRHFDQGVVETIGAKLYEVDPDEKPGFFEYFVSIPGIDPVGELPGTPVTFADPEDTYEMYQVPTIGVRLNNFRRAQQRFHPGSWEFRIPSPTANEVTVPAYYNIPAKTGFDKMLIGYQATPYDFDYTISVTARHRGGAGQRNQTLTIQNYLLGIFQPDGYVRVLDSLNDERVYRCTHDGVTRMDIVEAVNDRMMGFSLHLLIEGELNFDVPVEFKTVTQRPPISVTIHK